MIQDRALKIKLLNYYIHKYWYPQLEVDILSKQRLSSNRKLITDVDVLALFPDATGQYSILLGDCKTLKNQSPISRTLWMKGLMDYVEADNAIILLSKKVEKEHQLTSNHLGVQLLSEEDFDIYSKHTANYLIGIKSALADGEHWEKLFGGKTIFPKLEKLMEFSKSNFWNEPSSHNQLRSAIINLREHKSELNPANPLHLAITLNHFSLVAIALGDIINKTFSRYLLPASKEDLDKDLKAIIWGGIENYNYLNELRHKFSEKPIGENDLALPQWQKFIELVRHGLESPHSFHMLSLYLKEIAFTYLSNQQDHNYAEMIKQKDKYVTVFALNLSNYLVTACGIPNEFGEMFMKRLS
jgi:hypothetical protein